MPQQFIRGTRLPVAWASIAVVMLFAVACGNGGTGTQVRSQSYANDGYLGLTNTNPNLPTHPSYHPYKTDVQMIHNAALTVPGVRDTTVYLGNAVAYVALDLANDVADADVDRIKRKALEAITYNMPRYTVKVSADRENVNWLRKLRPAASPDDKELEHRFR